MTNEMDVLRRHRPRASGPAPELTEEAYSAFSEWLSHQTPMTTNRPLSGLKRWSREPLRLVLVGALLVAAAGVAIGVIGDGVLPIGPAVSLTEVNGLRLVVQESNIGPCLEVQTDEGSMAGGCGEIESPMSVGVGRINSTRFVMGWAPSASREIVITFANGDVKSITEVNVIGDYGVAFFVASLAPTSGGEPVPLDEAVALDAEGNQLAAFSFSG